MEHYAYSFVDQLLQDVTARKEEILGKARMEIDRYWEWFNEQNTQIANMRKVGETELKPTMVAPVLESRASGISKTYYIIWKKHSRGFRQQMRKRVGQKANASIPLHKYNSRNIISVLGNHCSWDLEQALTFEHEFQKYRVAFKAVHETEVRCRAALRKIESLGEAQTAIESTTEGAL